MMFLFEVHMHLTENYQGHITKNPRNPDRSQNYHIINSDTFSCWAVAELRLTKEPSSLKFETHLKPVSPFSVSDS